MMSEPSIPLYDMLAQYPNVSQGESSIPLFDEWAQYPPVWRVIPVSPFMTSEPSIRVSGEWAL